MASFEGGGCLEDPPFVASLLDTKGYFKEVECFMCPGLALDFVPWGTLSTLEEGLGALNATGLFAEHIANMWVIKGGSSGWYKRATSLSVLRMISSRLKPTCLAATKSCSYYGGFCSWFAI
ncbi:hypothetical protein Tco_0866866 [Tanacetum coccineum]